MTIQRWTLAVVCAATAMLMLDIAVVNTALSRIAEDLNTGLSGLQWVVDAYTLALASVVLTAGSLADRLGRRRAVRDRPHRSSRVASLACGAGARTSRCSTPPARCRASARRSCSPSRSRCSPTRSRAPGARRRARRLRRHDRRLVRDRPAGRRRAHQRPRLAVDLPRQHPDRHRLPRRSPARTSQESRDPARPRHRLARPDHADRRPVPARARAAARQRARLEERPRSSPSWSARSSRSSRSWSIERARRASRCCRCGLFRDRVVHGRADRGVRDLGVVLRDLPLHDALPAADPRAVGDRGRPRLPAGHDGRCWSSPARPRSSAQKVPARTMIAVGLGAGRGRHGAVHARRRRLVVDDPPAGRARRADRHRPVQPGA